MTFIVVRRREISTVFFHIFNDAFRRCFHINSTNRHRPLTYRVQLHLRRFPIGHGEVVVSFEIDSRHEVHPQHQQGVMAWTISIFATEERPDWSIDRRLYFVIPIQPHPKLLQNLANRVFIFQIQFDSRNGSLLLLLKDDHATAWWHGYIFQMRFQIFMTIFWIKAKIVHLAHENRLILPSRKNRTAV